jgi:penicillin-binding protein 1B
MPVVRRVRPSAPKPKRRRWRVLFFLAILLVIVGSFVIRPFWILSGEFDEITFRQPSRLYARATLLTEGRNYPPDLLIANLSGEGYREDTSSPELPAGRYRRLKRGLAVHQRSFPLPDGSRGGGLLVIAYRGGRVAGLNLDGDRVDSVVLDPPLLASYYGPDNQERRPVTLDEVSPDLIAAVTAAEDANFYRHAGFSLTGILRAFWVNLRGGEVRQGGSTLTQQLVKNLYLNHERTWGRKSRELVLAVLLEARYGKREILEAYLNEIYLGGSGGVSLLGVGAASRAYFGKDAGQLDLAEAATIAGVIRSPANYSPLAHPERAKERRDWVLGRMAELRLVPRERVEAALATPVHVAPEPVVRRRAPYFADSAALEASRRFGIDDLQDGGYVLFSTLDWSSQKAAQDAVDWGLKAVEKGYQKGHKGEGPLQAALISMDPQTGGILTYLGGRGYDSSQFDRVGRAQRQAGSAFKPIVYAAAFEAGVASPASFLEDSPLTVQTAGQAWSPKNDDGDFHGWISVRTALEKSYNPATTRLALQVGMRRVVKLAQDMGITTPLQPYPSMALGAASITPLELAAVYSTLASGGSRPSVHEISAILDRYGKPVAGAPLPKPVRVISPETAYMVTSLLQGVLQRGTAAGAANGIPGEVAGKTGTTNKQRDSWFAGYTPERVTIVWVGYDDNSRTRLSGARAALPIWVRFMSRVVPPGGYSAFPQPPGVSTALVDPSTGLLATEYCPTTLTEVFRQGDVPTRLCNRHQGWGDTQVAGYSDSESSEETEETAEAEEVAQAEDRRERPQRFRRWLRKVFGGGDDDRRRDREGEERGNGRPPG